MRWFRRKRWNKEYLQAVELWRHREALEHISYLSFSKVDSLYSQTVDAEPKTMSSSATTDHSTSGRLQAGAMLGLLSAEADVRGGRSRTHTTESVLGPIHKLRAVVAALDAAGQIVDLNEAISLGRLENATHCFLFSGEFTCIPKVDSDLAAGPGFSDEQRVSEEPGPSFHWPRSTSAMTVLSSRCGGFDLLLACSLKYFSDMGAGRVIGPDGPQPDDTFQVHPHSGNWAFFAGEHSAHFQALMFLTGQRGATLYGSPIVLVNRFSPDLADVESSA